ncbi:PTS sugar transporter subunit IIB [Oceanobacillus rekensis]|uniref:PTS sugar transporter subunit IIB n=1 Tax=Oceanobacillus rekensis TaxID=937927 RepID=UPI000B45001E|nr:PTS sugar transporter subunit IIB [Oceanobacillus rekensis]
MKKVLVICATGIATSTIIMARLTEWLKNENLLDHVELHQGKVSEAFHVQQDYDFIVSATIVPDDLKEKVIDGVPLLIGNGSEEVFDNIKNRIHMQ